jgi:hypothetical protein
MMPRSSIPSLFLALLMLSGCGSSPTPEVPTPTPRAGAERTERTERTEGRSTSSRRNLLEHLAEVNLPLPETINRTSQSSIFFGISGFAPDDFVSYAPETQETQEASDAESQDDPLRCVQTYYSLCRSRDLRRAYALRSAAKQRSRPFEAFSEGMQWNRTMAFGNLRLAHREETRARVELLLESTDLDPASGREVQGRYDTGVTLILEGGRWWIHDFETRVAGESR